VFSQRVPADRTPNKIFHNPSLSSVLVENFTRGVRNFKRRLSSAGVGKKHTVETSRSSVRPDISERFGGFARWVNLFVASPAATAGAFALVLLWALAGPFFHFSDGWQLLINTSTTIVTFLMVFVLNNAQSRDTSAMNAKLDALIIALDNADNRVVGLEGKNAAEASALCEEIQAAAAAGSVRAAVIVG
jgi:low affinity Fe/Cu permease